MEELATTIQPMFLACMMGAAVAADAAVGIFFGMQPAYDFRTVLVMPYSTYPWLVLLGMLCAAGGDLFKRGIYAGQDFYKRLRIPAYFYPIIPLLVSVPVGFLLIDATGGGHELIGKLGNGGYTLAGIALLFAVKLAFTGLSAGSGTGGGIFLPFLSCGALLGMFFGLVLERCGLLAGEFTLNMLVLGMAGYFAAVVRAPVTAIVLVLEMTGNMNHLISLVLVSFTAFVMAELLRSRPVYTMLYERLSTKKA
jgi:H+/Cl- antiporter ClcA